VLFGPIDDGGQRDLLAVSGFESGFDVAIFVGADRHVLVLNQSFFDSQFLNDVSFDGWGDGATFGLTTVVDGEARRVGLIGFDQGKEPGFSNPQDLLDVGSFDFVGEVTLEHLFDLTVGKLSMQLGHNQNLRFWL